MQQDFWAKINKVILKFTWKHRRPRIRKIILKKNKAGGLSVILQKQLVVCSQFDLDVETDSIITHQEGMKRFITFYYKVEISGDKSAGLSSQALQHLISKLKNKITVSQCHTDAKRALGSMEKSWESRNKPLYLQSIVFWQMCWVNWVGEGLPFQKMC